MTTKQTLTEQQIKENGIGLVDTLLKQHGAIERH